MYPVKKIKRCGNASSVEIDVDNFPPKIVDDEALATFIASSNSKVQSSEGMRRKIDEIRLKIYQEVSLQQSMESEDTDLEELAMLHGEYRQAKKELMAQRRKNSKAFKEAKQKLEDSREINKYRGALNGMEL